MARLSLKTPLFWLHQQIEPIQLAYERLPKRDRQALMVLSLFMTVFVLGGGLWWSHQAALQSQQQATDQRELLLWMQSQAPNLLAGQQNSESLTDVVQQLASQQNLVITQNGDDAQTQVSVTHDNFSVLGAWLSRLAEQGINVRQMDIRQQGNGQLQLQVTLIRQH
jgi:general secretion pathway protein M